MATLQCDIVTPERKLFSDQVQFVVLPAANGEMGVYASHEPVVTTLDSGSVRLTVDDGSDIIRFIVAGGYAQVDTDRVIVLADRAASIEELDKTAIQVHIDDLKEQRADLKDDDPNVAFLTSEIEWNELLLAQN